MKVNIFIALFISIILTGCFKDEGQVRIDSDIQNAIIYIDGDKKGMTGDGYTTIILEEGEHEVRVYKEKDEEYFYEGAQKIFVGANSSVKVKIETARKPTELKLERLAKEKKEREERLVTEKKVKEKLLLNAKNSLIFNSDFKQMVFINGKKRNLKLNNSSCVTSSYDELLLIQCETDNGPTAILNLNNINPKNPIIIERDVYIHPEYSRSYEGGDIFFTGFLSLNDEDDKTLVGIHYYKYEYQCNCDFFWIESKENKVNPIWNKWFKETIIYYPSSGKVEYFMNNILKLNLDVEQTSSNTINIKMHTYGWWEGHYTKMKNFKVFHLNKE